MKVRELSATVAISAVVAAGVGFGLGQANESATAAGGNSTKPIVKELKKVNGTLSRLESNVGSDSGGLSLAFLLRSVAEDAESIESSSMETCKSVSDSSFLC